MPDLAGAYRDTRTTMLELVRNLDAQEEAAHVPACPDWTVKDLIGHVTSIATRLADGTVPADLNLAANWDPATTEVREEMVAEEVELRRTQSLDDIIKDFESVGPRIDAMIAGEEAFPPGSPPMAEWVVLTDLAVHHHDLRGALGTPGDRDSLATGLSLRSYVEAMRFRTAAEKRPTMRLRAGSREWVIGEGDPIATVTADPFELARAASGRRSPDQVRAYDWDGDPEPFLDLFYPYGPRVDALVE